MDGRLIACCLLPSWFFFFYLDGPGVAEARIDIVVQARQHRRQLGIDPLQRRVADDGGGARGGGNLELGLGGLLHLLLLLLERPDHRQPREGALYGRSVDVGV